MNSLDHPFQSTCRSRRTFLQAMLASVPGGMLAQPLLAAPSPLRDETGPVDDGVTVISPHLMVFHGPIHVGIIHDGPQALVIDCGDGGVKSALDQRGISSVEQLLFTHGHRDQLCGAGAFPETAKRGVPEKEREYFSDPGSYWRDDDQLYRVYRSFRPGHRLPVEPVPVDTVYAGGDQFSFGPATIRVIDTPGHSEGSISYLVQVDGRRVLFSGDLIADDGKIWDIYSLQKGFQRGEQSVGGYHGFMGAREQLVKSLKTIKQCDPDLIVPSHGNLMSNPTEAIDKLVERLEVCYENYVSISALRYYFPALFEQYAGKPGQMPIRDGFKSPECLRHFGTTWMLVSESGAAFVMDVGSKRIVERLQELLADGDIKSVDALWVTHYHHDHTDGIVQFQREFDCPCITDQRLAEVLSRPTAWRLPCLIPDPITVHKPLEDSHAWTWREFKLTSYFCPGQTLYHAALLVEKDDLRMLFVGDSHTPAGLDDYCAHNRNFLGPNVGFQYCLSLIERTQPTHLFNCHVDKAFNFTEEEIAYMREQLNRREALFGELTPWSHANFATDPYWVRAAPYRQEVKPGRTARFDAVVINHANSANVCACRVTAPQVWGGGEGKWITRRLSAKSEVALPLSVDVPADAEGGRYVVPIDVRWGTA
ncbi:MAG: MBL fold metallo-hydrolase, partial [Planctomycetota bacterium]